MTSTAFNNQKNHTHSGTGSIDDKSQYSQGNVDKSQHLQRNTNVNTTVSIGSGQNNQNKAIQNDNSANLPCLIKIGINLTGNVLQVAWGSKNVMFYQISGHKLSKDGFDLICLVGQDSNGIEITSKYFKFWDIAWQQIGIINPKCSRSSIALNTNWSSSTSAAMAYEAFNSFIWKPWTSVSWGDSDIERPEHIIKLERESFTILAWCTQGVYKLWVPFDSENNNDASGNSDNKEAEGIENDNDVTNSEVKPVFSSPKKNDYNKTKEELSPSAKELLETLERINNLENEDYDQFATFEFDANSTRFKFDSSTAMELDSIKSVGPGFQTPASNVPITPRFSLGGK